MYLTEEKNAFAVASSLLLEMGKRSFPATFTTNLDAVFEFADTFGLTKLIDFNIEENEITNTAIWLALEGYLHQVDEGRFLLAEKSFNDVGFKIPNPTHKYLHFSRIENGELFFIGKDKDGFPADEKLKLQGVAKRFIYELPEN